MCRLRKIIYYDAFPDAKEAEIIEPDFAPEKIFPMQLMSVFSERLRESMNGHVGCLQLFD